MSCAILHTGHLQVNGINIFLHEGDSGFMYLKLSYLVIQYNTMKFTRSRVTRHLNTSRDWTLIMYNSGTYEVSDTFPYFKSSACPFKLVGVLPLT